MINIPAVKLFNGVEMPTEGFGVFQISETECKNIVLDAIHTGYRLIDTASSYKNEQAVGDAVKQAIDECIVSRDELFITTKAYIQEMGYDNLKWAFERSLKNLGLEYLDLYLIHMPLGDYYGAWRAMEELYEQGRIRSIGVCNFDSARLMDLCYNATIKPMVNQIERHPHYQRHDELGLMRKLGVQPEGWAPFCRIDQQFQPKQAPETFLSYPRQTPAQVILRWEIQQGVIIIPKSVHKNRMEENISIWDFELSDEDMRKINALDKNCPSMLDCSEPSEIDRLYNYLNNPVLTTL